MNGLNCAVFSAAAVEQVDDAGNSTITVFYLSGLHMNQGYGAKNMQFQSADTQLKIK